MAIEFLRSSAKKIEKDNPLKAASFCNFLEDTTCDKISCTSMELLQFSDLFENEITIRKFPHDLLENLADLYGISQSHFDSKSILILKILLRMLDLTSEDSILAKNLEKNMIGKNQLLESCKQRGIAVWNSQVQTDRYFLKEWTKISLHEYTPPSMLLLSPFLITRSSCGLPAKIILPGKEIGIYEDSECISSKVRSSTDCSTKHEQKQEKLSQLKLLSEAEELCKIATEFMEKSGGIPLNFDDVVFYLQILQNQIKKKAVSRNDLNSLKYAVEEQKEHFRSFAERLRLVLKDVEAKKHDLGKAFETYPFFVLWEIIQRIISDYGLWHAYASRNSHWRNEIPILLRSVIDFVHAERVNGEQPSVDANSTSFIMVPLYLFKLPKKISKK
ncbi:mitochondrial proton/calcium exchanger protein-like [Planococcus citri]|uniref:mitochondrial proton/calcium exchanger protein-like n=1 Tax=Planococcus citri TaxID=170843 RepID=UPI0031F9A17F